MNEKSIRTSLIIPAYQAEKVLPTCLQAVCESSELSHELIVVDDHSTDGTVRIAVSYGAQVLKTETHAGPAAARNVGARRASGDVLLFVDSDVVIRPDTLMRVSSHFSMDDSVAAVFGSYDDEPTEKDLVSQYKNLQHHFVHQNSNVDATTFWTGCGAVRREVFLEVGGFDEVRYSSPSIEDIELGYRIRGKGYRIVLDKQMCVKHLKRWTLWSHIRTEIVNRAIPWSNLIFENRQTVRDLNLTMSHRTSAGLVYLLILCIPLIAVHPWFIIPSILSLLGILLLNRQLFRFFWKKRGFAFALKALPLHLLHYAYGAAVFVLCWIVYVLRRTRVG